MIFFAHFFLKSALGTFFKKCIYTDAPSALLVKFYEKYYRNIYTLV